LLVDCLWIAEVSKLIYVCLWIADFDMLDEFCLWIAGGYAGHVCLLFAGGYICLQEKTAGRKQRRLPREQHTLVTGGKKTRH
jgi:hypothetical protein